MGRGTGKLTRSVLKRTEELRGHPPVDMEGALSASAHSEVVAPRAGRGGTTSSNPLCSSGESGANSTPRLRRPASCEQPEHHRSARSMQRKPPDKDQRCQELPFGRIS